MPPLFLPQWSLSERFRADQALLVYKLPSEEAMSESEKRTKVESSTSNSTEDLTVASPISGQLINSRPVKMTRVELNKDKGVAVHVSEAANVFSDPSDADSDADNYSRYEKEKVISDLKKQKVKMLEKLNDTKEMVRSLELKLAQEEAKNEMLVQFLKEVANLGAIVAYDDIDQIPKE